MDGGGGGRCLAAAWPRAARGWAGAEGTGGPEGPADITGSVVAVAPALWTTVVATAVAAAVPASAGAAAAREEPVSKTSDTG